MINAKLGNIYGILGLLSVLAYVFFFSLSRKQFTQISLLYLGLFLLFGGLYIVISRAARSDIKLLPVIFTQVFKLHSTSLAILVIGLICRLALLNQTPNLSQDFFRFIWDGHQLINGYNPYLYLPDEVLLTGAQHIPNASFLHAKMGALSAGNYTNYPPLNQLCFGLAAWWGGDSIQATMIWMRLMIISADIGVFFVGVKLLQWLNKPPYLILLYFLNPFVIIELTGNLHWEGVMAFLMLLAVYWLFVAKTWKSAIAMGAGVIIKLLPLIALPLVMRKLNFKKAFFYYSLVGIIVLAAFIPFFSAEVIQHYSSSVGLWFGNFEFNASLYYMIRWIGFQTAGYNIIGTVGKVLPVVTLICVLGLTFLRNNSRPDLWISSLLFSYVIYLLCSTTVHPWYLTIPLLFSIFTRFRFMLVWSLLVFLSYQAYSHPDYKENLLLIAVEYLITLSVLIIEIYKGRNGVKELG
ncbi:hypothetical protein [Nonlabens xiamenensis]|uniref:hypothetical protein n=1 Tax=Nonlabens xiamenensis TaxID=2341043 RepID=UPI001F0BECC1|nr:hypothetical protein [Nonlabens xiamenensis]